MARYELPIALYSLFPQQAAEAVRQSRMEWSASCPFCGGKDRFRVFAGENPGSSGRYWCRVCNRKGFLDDRKMKPVDLRAVIAKRDEERLRQEAERLERVRELQQEAYWRGYHDGMVAAGRALWRQRGLPDEAQDWFEFGVGSYNGHQALTIPYHNRTWDVETVQYRLLDTDGQGKYRFLSGYPATAYWTKPVVDGWKYIIAEGAIKAAVLYWKLVVGCGREYNIVGLTGKTPGRTEMERLGDDVGDSPVYLMLDPDASAEQRERVGAYFADTRYVTMPGKVDDVLNDGFPADELERLFIRQATRTAV